MRKIIAAAAALATAATCAAAAPSAEDVTREAVSAYRSGRMDAVFSAEQQCWARAVTVKGEDAALTCARLLIAGGVMDNALQRAERRGALPQFAPAAQRARYLQTTARMGLSPDDAQRILVEAHRGMPQIVATLAASGF